MTRIAFYYSKKRLFNRLISWWTKGKYSHVEIVLSDGTSYSSSFMDGGVRGKHIQFNGSNWDFINVSSLVEEDVIKKNIEKHIGKQYDLSGIIGFVYGPKKESKNKMFCSEFVMDVLGYQESWRFSPNTMFSVICKNVNEQH